MEQTSVLLIAGILLAIVILVVYAVLRLSNKTRSEQKRGKRVSRPLEATTIKQDHEPAKRKQPQTKTALSYAIYGNDGVEIKPLQVFICHSSSDKPKAYSLYQRLRQDGFDPWLDAEDLIPGQEWQIEIPKAVENSQVVLVCLSSSAITTEGYVQREIKFALDVADEKPEGMIYLIPVKLEPCEVPVRLSRWEWVDLFEEGGYERLLKALRLRAESQMRDMLRSIGMEGGNIQLSDLQ